MPDSNEFATLRAEIAMLQAENETLRTEVADTGTGIMAEATRRILAERLTDEDLAQVPKPVAEKVRRMMDLLRDWDRMVHAVDRLVDKQMRAQQRITELKAALDRAHMENRKLRGDSERS